MSKKLVLLIHGLGGDAKGTWQRFPELIRSDLDLAPRYDVGFYGYPSGLVRLPFGRKMSSIQYLARGLATEIRNRYASYEEVVLIGHSLGGLVARQYTLETIKSAKAFPVQRLMLIATPNEGAQLPKIGNIFSCDHKHLKQLEADSEYLVSLNDDWNEMDVKLKKVVRYVIAGLDQIVTNESARNHAKGSEIEFVEDKGHRDVVKPEHADEKIFHIVKTFLLEASGGGGRSNEPNPSKDDDGHAKARADVVAKLALCPGLQNPATREEILAALPFRKYFDRDGQYQATDEFLVEVCWKERRGFGALLDGLLEYATSDWLLENLCPVLDKLRPQHISWVDVLRLQVALRPLQISDSKAKVLYNWVSGRDSVLVNCTQGLYFCGGVNRLAEIADQDYAVDRTIQYVLMGVASQDGELGGPIKEILEVIELKTTAQGDLEKRWEGARALYQYLEAEASKEEPSVLRIKVEPDKRQNREYLLTAWLHDGEAFNHVAGPGERRPEGEIRRAGDH